MFPVLQAYFTYSCGEKYLRLYRYPHLGNALPQDISDSLLRVHLIHCRNDSLVQYLLFKCRRTLANALSALFPVEVAPHINFSPFSVINLAAVWTYAHCISKSHLRVLLCRSVLIDKFFSTISMRAISCQKIQKTSSAVNQP